MSTKTTSLNILKGLIDTSSQLARDTAEDAQKILTKAYPKEMVDCCMGKVEVFKQTIGKVQEEYPRHVTADVGTVLDQNQIYDIAKQVDALQQSLLEEQKSFKDGVHSDVKRLVG